MSIVRGNIHKNENTFKKKHHRWFQPSWQYSRFSRFNVSLKYDSLCVLANMLYLVMDPQLPASQKTHLKNLHTEDLLRDVKSTIPVILQRSCVQELLQFCEVRDETWRRQQSINAGATLFENVCMCVRVIWLCALVQFLTGVFTG